MGQHFCKDWSKLLYCTYINDVCDRPYKTISQAARRQRDLIKRGETNVKILTFVHVHEMYT